jgi:hypothetical protein
MTIAEALSLLRVQCTRLLLRLKLIEYRKEK